MRLLLLCSVVCNSFATDPRKFWVLPVVLAEQSRLSISGDDGSFEGGIIHILAWLVRGCLEWQKKGLGSAKVVDEAIEAYRNPQNDLEGFLALCCIRDEFMRVKAQDLYHR